MGNPRGGGGTENANSDPAEIDTLFYHIRRFRATGMFAFRMASQLRTRNPIQRNGRVSGKPRLRIVRSRAHAISFGVRHLPPPTPFAISLRMISSFDLSLASFGESFSASALAHRASFRRPQYHRPTE